MSRPEMDPVELESALLELSPSPARSAAAARWDLLARLLGGADLLAGAAVAAGLAAFLPFGGLRQLAFVAASAVSWLVLGFVCGLSARQELRTWASGIPDAARLFTTGLAMSWVFVGLAAAVGSRHVLLAAVGGPAVAVLSSATRAGARAFVHRLAPLRQRTVIIGSGQVAGEVAATIRRHGELGLELVGLVDDDPHHVSGPALTHLGTVAALPAVLREHAVDRVVIAFTRAGHDDLLQCVRVCRDGGVAIDIVPRLFEFLDGANALDQIGSMPLLSIGVPQLSRVSRGGKRALDLVGAGVGLAVLAPILGAVALAIRLGSPGPVLFRQPRAGRDGELFDVLKFRSMFQDAEERKQALIDEHQSAGNVMFKMTADPRITWIGRLIRKTSIDELPQLINVLRGEMSLVGPRPLVPQESLHLAEDWHVRRLDLRPGMTGLWQISGRSDITFRDMVRLDYQYVAGWSLARDVEILLATVPAVLGQRGAY